MKKVYFRTLGCKVNQYETQSMREQFLRAGFESTEDARRADLMVVNTCTVTQEADRKSRVLIRRLSRENSRASIAVTGCYATQNAEELERLPGVRFVIPNLGKEKIVESIGLKPEACCSNPDPFLGETVPGISRFADRTRAFVKIQDGCDHACTYCKIVLARGASKSRPFFQIMSEVKRLVAAGYREIVLAGIQLGAYGNDLSDGNDLVRILGNLSRVPGLGRIRLSSIDPSDVTPELIASMKNGSKICPHFHLPLQSGDDGVLKKMRRAYRIARYREIVTALRDALPDFSLTTDVMVGFPGETEQAFENTIEILKAIRPLKVHIFPFSPRKGTPAASFPGRVSGKILESRIGRLQAICLNLAQDFQRQFIGRTMEILAEGESSRPGWQIGHTANYLGVHFASDRSFSGEILRVKLKESRIGYMLGEIVSDSE
ncbi:MAG TPA: tRNA (N(6)-L-threonylcarbamoyladenosine(37)-C(2))-methylthiotransferase MtaB [Candidatus Omnitrophota bacterium]|nr:tRNA (N(6)-L-threonylcarbamoyladenosine(37)-C(2))-methylthiotransferase MtaB [Candidatus Omnitrophota bacterium]